MTATNPGKCGSVAYPLTEQIRDDVNTHGLSWAVRHHWKTWGCATPTQFRLLMKAAVLYC